MAATDYLLRTEGDLLLRPDTYSAEFDFDPTLGSNTSSANWRSTLGVAIGSDVQSHSSKLDAIDAVTTDAVMIYYDSATSTYVTAATTSFGRGLIGAADSSAAQTDLALVPGTDIQAYSSGLADIAGLTPSTDQSIKWNGSNWVSYTPVDNARGAGNGLSLNVNDLEIDTSITCDLTTAQTLSNKTMDAPSIEAGVLVDGVVLENVSDNTKFSFTTVEAVQTTSAAGDDIYAAVMGDDSVVLVECYISALESDGSVNAYKASAVFARGTGAASARMVSSSYNPQTLAEEDNTLSFNLSPDTTNGGYIINVVGNSSNTVDWVAKVSETVIS